MADEVKSPLAIFHEHCEKGELAYQVNPENGQAVFYPRAVAPNSAQPTLKWRVSQGVGTVHKKNWDPLVLGPAFAMESMPGPVCFSWKFSSANFSP